MLLPACAKARGISPSTLLMTPGCRPEDICHCVPGGGAHGSSPGPHPHRRSSGRRSPRETRAGEPTYRCERSLASGSSQRGEFTDSSSELVRSADSWPRARGFCYMRPRVRPRSLRFLTSAWRRSRAKWEVQWKLWFLSPELAGGAWPGSVPGGRWPVSGVEHSLPAAVRRTLLETLGWLGRRRAWRACVCARACVHARVHLPAPVSSLLLSRFSENSSVHD